MKNSKIFLFASLLIAFLSAVYFVGCKQNSSEPQTTSNNSLDPNCSINKITLDNLEIKELIKDELKDLLTIRNNFTKLVNNNKVDIQTLKTAYLAADEKKIAELLKVDAICG